MKKNKINNMTPDELEDYVNQLPEEIPPRWSSVGWLAAIGLISIIIFINNAGISSGHWLFLVSGLASFVAAGYLIYKILTFGK